MHRHQVEVDDQVFEYVKTNAEPLVDSFNSALRRLLKLDKRSAVSGGLGAPGSASGVPELSLPRDVPQALRHILEVAYLVTKHKESRTDATRTVAKNHGVTAQTVLDKYCRQLELTAAQFDRLLDDPRLAELKKILERKFPEQSRLIGEIL